MSSEEQHISYFAKSKWNLCCKQATYLLLKKEELQKLSFKDEASLKFHMAICKFCRAFKKQSAIMNEVLHQSATFSDVNLTDAEKSKLKLLINSNLNGN